MNILTQKVNNKSKERFLRWFPHRYKWISRKLCEGSAWTTNNWHPLNDEEVLDLWLDDEIIIGLRFGTYTPYAMLDIDKNSNYHPNNSKGAIQAICASLESIGLVSYVPVRSSDSEGLHLYFPLPYPMHTFSVAKTIKLQLQKDGFNIEGGQLEIFPNTKNFVKKGEGFSNYNGHRLPLQLGSYLLDDDFHPCSQFIETWCDWMDWASNRQDMEQLHDAIEEAKKIKIYFNFKKSTKNVAESNVAQEWRKNLEAIIDTGWTAKGQTNEILKTLQTYGKVFLKLSGDELIDWMVNTAISSPGYKTYCGHQHEIKRRCQDWVRCTEAKKHYLEYRDVPERLRGCKPKPENQNITKALNASNRILEVVNLITDRIFSTTRDLLLWIQDKTQELFGIKVSSKTLYKNKCLWNSLINGDESSTESNPIDEIDEVEHDENISEALENESMSVTASVSESESVLHLSIYEGVGVGGDAQDSQKLYLSLSIKQNDKLEESLMNLTNTINMGHNTEKQIIHVLIANSVFISVLIKILFNIHENVYNR